MAVLFKTAPPAHCHVSGMQPHRSALRCVGQGGAREVHKPDSLDRTMQINLRGPMLGCKYAIPEGREGIRCNAVAPGVVISPAVRALHTPESLAGLAPHHVTANWGSP